LGIILTKRGNLDEAIEHLYKAVEHNPLDADIHYDLALVLAMKGQIEQAMEQFFGDLKD
jgi:Flp pilus assembly protein TadD